MKQHRSKGKSFSKPKERVEDMTEMINSMFAPCVAKRNFDDYESYLYPKIKELITGESTKPLRLPPGGYEETMQRTFADESALYSNEMTEDVKKTIKAHYMMAGGFSDDLKRLSEEARKEEEEEEEDSCVIQEEINTGRSTQLENVQELPFPTYSLGEIQAERFFLSMEKEAESRREWEYKDYAEVAIGCGTVAFVLFTVYRFLR